MQSIWEIIDRLCSDPSIRAFLAPAPKKDWFLYLMMDHQISRLNIDEFCRTFEKTDHQLELLYENSDCDDSSKLPLDDMEHTRVGSKVQMWYNPNELHYCFDPTDPDGPSIQQCDDCNDYDLLHKAAFTLEDKFYSFYPNFEVFDPLHQLWKRLLPNPLDEVEKVYALGHKLVFQSTQRPSYMFDTREGKWEDWPERSQQSLKYVNGKLQPYYGDMIDIWTTDGMQAAVEHEGFLIAPLHIGNRLAAFRWDSDGVPKLYRVLHELDPIFHSGLVNIESNAMGKCDGGRIWLVYNGYDTMDCWHTRIGVFRVSVSNDLDGIIPVLSAQVEATKSFSIGESRSIKSAFALCHQPNLNEEKIRVIHFRI